MTTKALNIAGFLKGNYGSSEARVCDTTGLPVSLTAQLFIKLNAVMAVVFLLLGGIAALLIALTRWPTVHLLPAEWYYRLLTFHGLNMLIFWIIFMEVAILYFTCTTLLNSKLFSAGVAWASFALMLIGSILVDYMILGGYGDVLMTSYIPLKAHPLFYFGIIVFAVGALIAVFNFFATLYIAKRDKTYEGSVPLVVFGAIAAAIIAVFTILHGAVAVGAAFIWSTGWIQGFTVDAVWYRMIWWGLGHASQQINVTAMVSVWYLIMTMAAGARPLNQAVCRGAFVLYILFINLASAHHALVDPGVSASWKIWNTSYAMYLAVLASMIHGFTVPASLEVAMRKKGYDKGLFGWLLNAPWKNPAFSAGFMSLVIFGFIGGITGVTLGTQQINIIAHNTLRIPGHFHATVVGGTTLAFMGLAYYVVPLIFQREYYWKGLARIQPLIFAVGIVTMLMGMQFAGSYGVPRRHWDVEFTGAQLSAGVDPGAHIWLGLLGVGGIIAFTGLLIFVLLTVAAVFFGKSNAGKPMESWGEVAPLADSKKDTSALEHKTPGTMVLVIILLVSFVVYYFANWKALADVWYVR
ncbi:MAG: cbb3-type cytochrome c oxidase subunit I [Leptospiraceae bacterium]|nr:cbb3-type cytochrome c oxidase subunit I [Leptospiraceae bacterium]MCK6381711.1 cbb3-type cytochrome c oxidase subunit I [Leptospiraceae bacterium]